MSDYIRYIREKVGHDVVIMVGCGVFVYKDGKLLLQRRKDSGCWAMHGGSMEIGETTEETASRELFEETGLIAKKLELLGIFSGPDMMHTYPNGDKVYIVGITYICQKFSGNLLSETDETTELKWFDINNLPADINPPDKRPLEAFVVWARNTNKG
ncbi:MAG: NUDIX hydrolase [Defluviitaleaceae bacterium]|nr:NUDIX hydrolase [Defluviitaleaceae bacterium]